MALPSDPTPIDPDGLFARARAGDNAAWEELFNACYPKVKRVVARKLDRQMRTLFDSTDFASDVMKSLAANVDRLDFPSFSSLIAFLVQVAEQKVIDEYRKVHTQKRDIDRQRPLITGDGADAHPLSMVSYEPTASQVAQADEAIERLMAGQNEDEREAIDLKKQGYTNPEIARKTGWNLRKVQRFFKDLWDEYRQVG